MRWGYWERNNTIELEMITITQPPRIVHTTTID